MRDDHVEVAVQSATPSSAQLPELAGSGVPVPKELKTAPYSHRPGLNSS